MNYFRKIGKKIFYVTNNSTKIRSDFAAKAQQLGFIASQVIIKYYNRITLKLCKNIIQWYGSRIINKPNKLYVYHHKALGSSKKKFQLNAYYFQIILMLQSYLHLKPLFILCVAYLPTLYLY